MQTYDMLFLFAFLPVYMGVFAVIPAKRRAWAIMLGNLVTAVTGGLMTAAVYAVCTGVSYFSGIAIYNMRNDDSKAGARRIAAVLNYIFAAAVMLICSPRGIALSVFAPFRAALFAVLPLHMISYITDVYRGDCEAQTNIAQLAAYLGFFPSAGYGPVYRYKTVRTSFAEPKTDVGRLSDGIRYYIMGLAAYVVIAVRLDELHHELLATPADQLRGFTAFMGVLVYYAGFGTSVIASVFMGQGLAVMQGIRTGHTFRRRFMQPSIKRRLREFNLPFCRWLRDYITIPLRRAGVNTAPALAAAILLGALWYGLNVGWLAAGAVLAAAVSVQTAAEKRQKHGEPYSLIASAVAKLVTLAAVSCAALWELVRGKAGFALLRIGGANDDFFYTFFGEAVLPTILGLVITGSLLHSLIKRMNLSWFKLVLPLTELVFLAIATAYMVR